MSSFKYQALPDDRSWTRLLKLHSGLDGACLIAELEAVEMQKQPQYEAISYCWGSDETPCELWLKRNGQNFCKRITRNLDYALRRLRSEFQERVLWTDAICIDQRNNTEKKQQVRLMATIYTSAAQVLVYLGEPCDTSRRAVKLMNRIYNAAKDAPTKDERSALQYVKDSKLPSLSEPWRWEPLKMFFRRQWFRRKWIIQECCLAKEAVFHCGDWTCNWDFMSLVVSSIYDRGLGVLDYTIDRDVEEVRKLQLGLSQVNTIRLYKRGISMGRSYRFLDLAYHFQTSEAGDARDQLFALLAMANDSQDEELDPDYNTANSMVQNCIRYARHFLNRDSTLEVLYRAGLSDQTMLAPSWIPNWYGRQETFGFEINDGPWSPQLRPPHLNIARRRAIILGQTTDAAVLAVRGIIIDSITELANAYLSQSLPLGNVDKATLWRRRRQHLLESDSIMSRLQVYRTGERSDNALWRTLICNTTQSGEAPEDSFRNSYEAWRRDMFSTTFADQIGSVSSESLPFSRMIGSWHAAKIFGSTTERYVGMFPRCAKEGDKVAILYGGEFPFVLRHCSESMLPETHYQLVGQCYVHGIMEAGQFDLEEWSSKEQDIFLE